MIILTNNYFAFRVHENIGYGIFVQGLNGVSKL